MIWYKFYLGDYITHTNHLSDAEDLAYRRLLDLYYISEKPIPLETESITETKPKVIPNQIQIQNKKISSVAPTTSRFDDFWSAWPSSKRKVARAECEKKWFKQNLDKVADTIIASVSKLKRTEQWTTGFDPAPLTYINQRRWEDDAGEQQTTRRVI